MDSITHLFAGAAIAAACVPAAHRRAALLAGAVLQTLPDLDVIPLHFVADPVANMTWHRGPTHSLLLAVPFAVALWAWLKARGERLAAGGARGFGTRVAEAPRAWLAAIVLGLCTHPVLDAFTVYGTQLLWPLPLKPVMWASVFIIDPAFTLPLLLAVLVAGFAGARPLAARALAVGLALSTAYLGWSLVAKGLVEREVARTLAGTGLEDAPRFSVPMPFNTLLWRIVVMTPDGFLEGERSLVADRGPIVFRAYRSDVAALDAVDDHPDVRRLLWFNHHFAKAQVRDGKLVISDLRMGAEPDYSFRFAVAARDGDGWRPIPVEQYAWPWEARRRLPGLWRRIWAQPGADD